MWRWNASETSALSTRQWMPWERQVDSMILKHWFSVGSEVTSSSSSAWLSAMSRSREFQRACWKPRDMCAARPRTVHI